MATELKLRKGTTTEHGSFTGAEAEATVDTDKNTIVVHDGQTQGGFPLSREDSTDVAVDSVATLRASSFPSNLERLWLSGYYGVGTAGGGPLFRSSGTDDGGVKFEAGDGSVWERDTCEGPIYITWFGAKGDGVADDTDAIREAINYASGVQTVFVPAGEYSVNDTIEMSDGIYIKGEGDGSILSYDFSPSDTSIAPMFGESSSATNSHYEFDSIYFRGPGTVGVVQDYPDVGNDATLTTAIKEFTGSPFIVRNCLFTGFGYDTVRLTGTSGNDDPGKIIFENNRVEWCVRGFWMKHGIRDVIVKGNRFEGVSSLCAAADDLSTDQEYGPEVLRITITNNIVLNCVTKFQTAAFWVQGGKDVSISGNVIVDVGDSSSGFNGSGIALASGGTPQVSGLTRMENAIASNNVIRNSVVGVNIQGSSGAKVSGNSIIDCGEGVKVQSSGLGDSSRVVVGDNYIGTSDGESEANAGIVVEDSSQEDVQAVNNTLYNLSQYIDDNGTRTVSVGNRQISSSSNPEFPAYPIDRIPSIKGQVINTFVLTVTNDGGTIRHKWQSALDRSLDGVRDEWLSGINNVTSSFTDTPYVESETDFSSGGGVLDGDNTEFVIDCVGDLNNTPVEGIGLASVVYNDTGSDVLVRASNAYALINGETKRRPNLKFSNGGSGTDFAINTSDIPSGSRLEIQCMIGMPLQ